MTPNGLWQAYYLDKQRLIKLARTEAGTDPTIETAPDPNRATSSSNEMPTTVLDLARRCLLENDGRLTLTWLHTTGRGQKAARRLQTEWTERGWAVCDPARDNARCVSLSVCRALDLGLERWRSGDTPTNPAGPTNRPEVSATNRQTVSEPGDKPDKPAAEDFA